MRLTNKVALVTGSTQGIGLGIAERLAKTGYTIALHYHTSEEKAQESLRKIRKLQPKSSLYHTDLADIAAVEKLIPRVYKDHPDLCVLINNASHFEKHTISDTDIDTLQRDIRVHYIAPFLLIRDFAQYVKKGVVINMLDARIRKNNDGNASYFVSKKALASLTEIAALELAPAIRVNAIAPGAILPPPGKS